MTHRSPWLGRLRLEPGLALYVGPAGDTGVHAHHALQIAVGLEGPVEVGTSDGPGLAGTAILVPPDAPHQLRGAGRPAALLFLEPESALGRGVLAAQPGPGARVLEEGVAGALQAALLDPDTDPGSLLQGLAPEAAPRTASLDPRVGRAIRALKEAGGAGTLEAAARSLGLSPSRLGHLFSAQVGLPFRPYALWLRLQGALAHLARGANLTEAAHGAGFADSAHLTRTFRRMFGVAPSDLARSARESGPRTR